MKRRDLTLGQVLFLPTRSRRDVGSGQSVVSGASAGDPSERLGSLDALRMFAAIAVFTYHVSSSVSGVWDPHGSLLNGGYVGVSMFFVLSGFLLYRPFLGGGVDLRTFALKRVARIYPAYWFALVPMALLDWNGFSSAPMAFMTLTQNYVPEMSQRVMVQAWTLGVEVAFYACLPVLGWLLARRTRSAQTAVLAVLACASLVSVQLGLAPHGMAHLANAFWQFVPGMLLAVWMPRRSTPALTAGAMLLGAGYVGAAYIGGLAPSVSVVAGTALLIVGLPQPSGWKLRLALAAGALSYSFYLWHVAVLIVVRPFLDNSLVLAAVAGAATVAIAAVAYIGIEEPAIRWARGRGRGRVTDIGGWKPEPSASPRVSERAASVL